ncbi:MAG: DUF6798 domain-containing protein [Phycisphaeraceae bacterium]
MLLALIQAPWAGYQLGVGNQSIQVAFLLRLHDPAMFGRDQMVNTTLPAYPSLFFAALSRLLGWFDVPTLYLGLHLVVTAGLFVAVAVLTRAAVKSHWAALVAMLFLLAGHQQALAGELLYSTGLTHTWASFPIAVLALACCYRNWGFAAFALAGALFNLHALESAYIAMMLGLWAVLSIRRIGVLKVLGMLAVYGLLASPTLVLMISRYQHFGGEWMTLMHIRSAQNSFPSTWWQAGNPDLPRLATLVGLAVLAMSFRVEVQGAGGIPAKTPKAASWPGLGAGTASWPGLGASDHLRKTVILASAIGVAFVIGYVFTEIWPVPLVIRAQLFRSSRFLVLLALVYIAYGCVRAWGMPFGGSSGMESSGRAGDSPTKVGPPGWRAWLEFASATVTALAVAVPPLGVFLPVALLLAILVAWVNARLTWAQAAVAGAALIVCLLAWRWIHFLIPGLSSEVAFTSILDWRIPGAWGLLALAGVVLLWWLAAPGPARLPRAATFGVGGIALAACVALSMQVWGRLSTQAPSDPAWVDVQTWARDHTAPSELFLTPAQPGGFRTHAHRSVVAEWRDGTQLYFSQDYADLWWQRMNDVQPGMLIAPDRTRLLVHGKSLARLDDEEVIKTAQRYSADYVVLPVDAARKLEAVYANAEWGVYRPRIAEPPPIAEGDTMAAQERFLQDVVLPNIRQHRQSEARVQVVDAQGRPVYDLPYTLRQTGSTFLFGATLPFFAEAGIDAMGDYQPGTVTPVQLEHFAELFNYSVTGLSGAWMYLEPQQGKRDYRNLDAYLDWCRAHGVAVEFSFLSGFQPAWVKAIAARGQARLLSQHAHDLLARYADRVAYWQVTDQGIMVEQAPGVYTELRRMAESEVARGAGDQATAPASAPGVGGPAALASELKLGLGDAARFHSWASDPKQREADMRRGLADLRRLKQQGVTVDFVALHADRPWGLWADAQAMYDTLDAFAGEGVAIHLTQVGVPLGAAIEGDVKRGTWTPALQAQYYRTLFMLAYGHPAVEAVNLIGIGVEARMHGAGVLDAQGQPTPAFQVLKQLITEEWRSRVAGKLSLDGVVSFRGYHGPYELALTLPSGKVLAAPMQVGPEGENSYRFTLDRGAETLTPRPE